MASKSKQSKTEPTRSDAPVRTSALVAIRLFTFAAMAISAYLAYISMTGDRVVGCGPDSGCEQVLNSRWAYWLNVPVSFFALIVYSLILGGSFRFNLKREPKVQRMTWAWLVGSAIIVFGSAAWFVGIQAFVLKSFCPFCMTAHACGAIAALLIFVNAPLRSPAAKPWELEKLVFLAPRVFRRVLVVALLALAVLVIGQVKFEHRSLVVRPANLGTNPPPTIKSNTVALAPASVAVTNPVAPTAVAATPPPATAPTVATTKRLVPIYGNRFQLDTFEAPILGAPTNQHVIVSLFDYTCHHCRAMHPLLHEAQAMFSNQLAIISLPMPLDPDCNPTMQKAHPSHTNACALAKLGLAVWRADRTKHHEFDNWMMEGAKPPPLVDAQLKAAQLVGAEALARALQDPWVENQLRVNVAMYELSYRAQRGQMPQLIVGPNVALGTYTKPELIKLLTDNLALQPAP